MTTNGYGSQVEFVVGSRTDLPQLAKAEVDNFFRKLGITCRISVISAHRNSAELAEFCREAFNAGTMVFMAAAGWAAALAGAVAANTHSQRPVIGIGLPGGPLSPFDSLSATLSMPPGAPVATFADIKNACLHAAQIIALTNPDVNVALATYLAIILEEKKPQLGTDLEAVRQGVNKKKEGA